VALEATRGAGRAAFYRAGTTPGEDAIVMLAMGLRGVFKVSDGRRWCERDGCGQEIPVSRGLRGGPAKYCSVRCRKDAHLSGQTRPPVAA
jgi:hypothetical protein